MLQVPNGFHLELLPMNATPLPAEWLALAQRLMPDVHPHRQREWAYARLALARALATLQMSLTPENYHAEGFQKLRTFSVRFSLSHTKNWVAALATAPATAAGFGVDIEEQTRRISPDVEGRMLNSADTPELSPLQRWALKEAAFKALSEEEQQGIWLNNLAISSTGEVHLKEKLLGNWQVVPHHDLIIGIVTRPR